MWRQQIHADQIADETISTNDILNWSILLEDLNQEVIDSMWGWWVVNYNIDWWKSCTNYWWITPINWGNAWC